MPEEVKQVAEGRYERNGRAWVYAIRCALCGELGAYPKTECCPFCEEVALARHGLILSERKATGQPVDF